MKGKMKNKFADVLDDLQKETDIYSDSEKSQEDFFSSEKFLSFPFNLEQDKIEFLRNFVTYKRKSDPAFFHYNNSSAIREGLELLDKEYPELRKRPAAVKIPTRYGTRGRLNGVIKIKTSYWINEVEREFIYNFIYMKSLTNEDYNKSEFMDDLINALTNEYPDIKKTIK